ncbi:MAG: hypothetical protein HOO06_00085 [Bdellovibrionaceae bacterium]|nr:hypothetical protein [Pseudobdellovibrionaceae bacterium]
MLKNFKILLSLFVMAVFVLLITACSPKKINRYANTGGDTENSKVEADTPGNTDGMACGGIDGCGGNGSGTSPGYVKNQLVGLKQKLKTAMHRLYAHRNNSSLWYENIINTKDGDLGELFSKIEDSKQSVFLQIEQLKLKPVKKSCLAGKDDLLAEGYTYTEQNTEEQMSKFAKRDMAINNKKEVCISLTRLSRYSKTELELQLLALLFHELHHTYGISEFIADKNHRWFIYNKKKVVISHRDKLDVINKWNDIMRSYTNALSQLVAIHQSISNMKSESDPNKLEQHRNVGKVKLNLFEEYLNKTEDQLIEIENIFTKTYGMGLIDVPSFITEKVILLRALIERRQGWKLLYEGGIFLDSRDVWLIEKIFFEDLRLSGEVYETIAAAISEFKVYSSEYAHNPDVDGNSLKANASKIFNGYNNLQGSVNYNELNLIAPYLSLLASTELYHVDFSNVQCELYSNVKRPEFELSIDKNLLKSIVKFKLNMDGKGAKGASTVKYKLKDSQGKERELSIQLKNYSVAGSDKMSYGILISTDDDTEYKDMVRVQTFSSEFRLASLSNPEISFMSTISLSNWFIEGAYSSKLFNVFTFPSPYPEGRVYSDGATAQISFQLLDKKAKSYVDVASDVMLLECKAGVIREEKNTTVVPGGHSGIDENNASEINSQVGGSVLPENQGVDTEGLSNHDNSSENTEGAD